MPEASNIIDPINQTTKLKEQDFDTDDNLEPSTDSNKKDWKIFTNCLQYIKNGLYNGIQTTKHSLSNVALYTLQLLKNPMILMNCVVGIGFISVIFLGYIKYEKRFLMGFVDLHHYLSHCPNAHTLIFPWFPGLPLVLHSCSYMRFQKLW